MVLDLCFGEVAFFFFLIGFNLFTSDQSIQILYFFMFHTWKVEWFLNLSSSYKQSKLVVYSFTVVSYNPSYFCSIHCNFTNFHFWFYLNLLFFLSEASIRFVNFLYLFKEPALSFNDLFYCLLNLYFIYFHCDFSYVLPSTDYILHLFFSSSFFSLRLDYWRFSSYLKKAYTAINFCLRIVFCCIP